MDINFKRPTGFVKCYFPLKGFGFIQREHGKDVFFFRTDASSENILHDGARVSFLLTAEPRGPRALDIVRIA